MEGQDPVFVRETFAGKTAHVEGMFWRQGFKSVNDFAEANTPKFSHQEGTLTTASPLVAMLLCVASACVICKVLYWRRKFRSQTSDNMDR